MPDLDAALTAARRVLTAPGELARTVPHPCFEAPHASWTQAAGGPVRRVVGHYLAQGFWRSDNPEGARRAGNQHRTLSTYLTALVRHGFVLETVTEPAPSARVAGGFYLLFARSLDPAAEQRLVREEGLLVRLH